MDLPSWDPLSRFMVAGRLDHKVPNPHVYSDESCISSIAPAAFALQAKPVAVIFDLVEPVRAAWDHLLGRGNAELNVLHGPDLCRA